MKRVALAVLVALLLLLSAAPAQARWTPRITFLEWINDAREDRGIRELDRSWSLQVQANRHSRDMAADGHIYHSRFSCYCGEIVGIGHGGGLRDLFEAFMSSPAHRSVILHRGLEVAGVGVYAPGDGFIWLTVIFRG